MSKNELKYYEQVRELASLLCSTSDDASLVAYIDQLIENVHSQRYQDQDFKKLLRDSILPKWIERFDEEQQLADGRGQQLTIREHCHRLAQVIFDIELRKPVVTEQITGEKPTWSLAADWLGMASSVNRISIVTGYYDASLMYCGGAMKYEDERSRLMSHLVYQLAIFNFVWGGFETISKLIDLPRVPKNIKPRSSWVDSTIYFLKNEYEPQKTVAFYDETVADLREMLRSIPFYDHTSDCFSLSPLQGVSGIGISAVRRLRNSFAHGSWKLPLPGREGLARPLDAILVEMSTRCVLYTIQMLLLAHLKGHYFDVELIDYHEWGWWGEDVWEEIEYENVDRLLRSLHINVQPMDENQPSLFELFEER